MAAVTAELASGEARDATRPLALREMCPLPESHSPAEESPWHTWNSLRTLCDHSPQICVALEFTRELPDDAPLRRWLAEPVRAALIPTSVFLRNKAGFPVLPKRHQEFFLQLLSRGVQFVLTGRPEHGSDAAVHSGGVLATAAGAMPVEQEMMVVDGSPPCALSKSEEPPGVLAGTPACSATSSPPAPYAPYLAYLSHLASAKAARLSAVEEFEAPFVDVLQSPLQPLADNLESATYEVFERDPVKYQGYEDAVVAALQQHAVGGAAAAAAAAATTTVAAATTATGTAAHVPGASAPVVIMVVGAGRGPLVRRVLAAAARTAVPVRVYAVEKNPNAVITLRNLVLTEGWEDTVTVVAGDMRAWAAPEPADILVSELLGSFGDNELSPECLDGAQRFLRTPSQNCSGGINGSDAGRAYCGTATRPGLLVAAHAVNEFTGAPLPPLPAPLPPLPKLQPVAVGGPLAVSHSPHEPPPQSVSQPLPRWWRPETGVSIPCSSTSFLAPVHTPKLWHQARAFAPHEPLKWMETPYVVRMASAMLLAAPIPAFTFHHPNLPVPSHSSTSSSPTSNARSMNLRWEAAADGVIHGFAGYFDAHLYGGVHISINPDTHSPGMFSWFPLYFPLRDPVTVRRGDVIQLWLSRCVSTSGQQRVWYEWGLTAPQASPLHNPNGRSYYIGL